MPRVSPPPPVLPPPVGHGASPGSPSDIAARQETRERLARRLVGLVVLTVAFSAASTLLPPRGSADRTPPAPDENAPGVEVQTVPLGGLPQSQARSVERDPASRPSSVAAVSRASPALASTTSVADSPATGATTGNAEFAQDAPAAAREAPTLKDVAAEEFDERRLAPTAPSSARDARPPPVPVAATPVAPVETAPAVRPVAASGAEAWVVQVGVFSTRAKADGVASQIRSAGLPPPRIEAVQVASGATRYRVRIPTGADGAAARAARDRVNRLPGAFGAEVRSIPAGG